MIAHNVRTRGAIWEDSSELFKVLNNSKYYTVSQLAASALITWTGKNQPGSHFMYLRHNTSMNIISKFVSYLIILEHRTKFDSQ